MTSPPIKVKNEKSSVLLTASLVQERIVNCETMTTYIQEKYDYVMKELADPRAKNLLGLSSPWPTLAIIAVYLLSVYVILPTYMKNKKPYNLNDYLYYYNILQIVSCVLLIYGIATSGWTTHYSLGCQPVDYSNDPLAVRMVTFVHYTYLLKGIELTETLVFVLRKKFNQVSKLHVYHHASTFLLTWIGTKFVAGGMATFPIMVNSFIHILMYSYYLLSSLGPKWQTIASKWKSTLTLLQMIQLCILIVHSLQSLHPDCGVPKLFLALYVPNILAVLLMFWEFYQNSYSKQQHKSK